MSEPAEHDDQVLVAAVQRGDVEALDALVARYHAPLSQFLERMLSDRDTAQDVVQETFLRMIRALPRYRPQAKFSTWLYTIATNLARDELRRQGRAGAHQHPDGDERTEELPANAPAVADQALQRVADREVRQALRALSPDHRTVVVLHYYEGLSYKEIASVCGCTIGTVGSRLHYAVKHLRRHMGLAEEGST